jgi:sulfur-oxidizing protein SoxA
MNGGAVGIAVAAAASALVVGLATVLAPTGEASGPVQLAQAAADAGGYKSEPVREFKRAGKMSGYLFATPETQRIQDDDFENPSFLWVDHGEQMWTKVEGSEGKSCLSCHGLAATMRGVGVTYPKINKETGKLFTLEHQINYCRTERMKAPELKWETMDMLGIAAFVMHQSRGLPYDVAIDGPAKPYFERGEKLYHTRRGQLNLACIHCHQNNAGNYLRADLLSEGMISGYPLYRLKWQRIGSIHYRLEECYGLVRAETEPYGSEELTTLQLYLAWRAGGLLSEAPGVRR